jgi:predicted RNase H-like nuclease
MAVEAATYEEANRICRSLTGQGLSRQAWALAPKILDVLDPI